MQVERPGRKAKPDDPSTAQAEGGTEGEAERPTGGASQRKAGRQIWRCSWRRKLTGGVEGEAERLN